MRIVEELSLSKHGLERDNEDALFHGDDLVLLLDGATSKKGERVNGKTGGRFAVEVIKEYFQTVDLNASAFSLLSGASARLKDAIENRAFTETPSASVLYYNAKRREIVRYGDCNFLLDNKEYFTRKKSDERLSKRRAEVLEKELALGRSIEELQEADVGRQAIVPDILRANEYANRRGGDGFPVLNGGELVREYVEVYPVRAGSEVVFGSDGYPRLKDTLAKSEEYLSQVIEKDPLCISLFKSTKGVMKGQVSFDDRSYIRFIAD